MREVRRKLSTISGGCATAIARLNTLLERAERIRTQQINDKNKLYALHAPEVECISKGKARKRYEFGVKSSILVTHKSGLVVGARTFPGNPYDGHVLSAQLEQTRILLEDTGKPPKQVFVDLGYRGVDRENPNVEIIHRGKYCSLTQQQRRCLRRRPAVEPTIGHLKADHRMNRCWLPGKLGDALHTVLCATGFNLRWLLRAMVRLGLRAVFFALAVAGSAGSDFRKRGSAGCASRTGRRVSGLVNGLCRADQVGRRPFHTKRHIAEERPPLSSMPRAADCLPRPGASVSERAAM